MRNLTIAFMFSLSLLACAMLLSACGSTDYTTATQASNCEQPSQSLLAQYRQCLSHNTNYQGSPAWYYFNEQCRLRFNIPQPYPVNYVNQVDDKGVM